MLRILESANISSNLFDDYLSIIGIDRVYERKVKRKSAVRFNYIIDRGNGWWSPPSNWSLSNAQIARHLAGKEVIGIRAGKFKSPVSWVDFDIDNAHGDVNDKRIVKLVEFFGQKKCLIQLRRESGNFSILLRCLPLHPKNFTHQLHDIVSRIGLNIIPGQLEIYPDLNRGRRLPLGGGVTTELSDDWKLEKYPSVEVGYPVQFAGRINFYDIIDKSQQIEAFRDLPPIDISALYSKHVFRQSISLPIRRKPSRNPLQQSDDATRILHEGLSEESTRYEAEKKLIRFCWAKGHSEQLTYKLIKNWYETGKTNDKSKDWARKPAQVIRWLKNHVRTFYRWLGDAKAIYKKSDGYEHKSEKLSTVDIRTIIEICEWDLHFAEWLYDLLVFARTRHKYINHLILSSQQMREFRNGRDYHKKWLPSLEKLGIIRCTDRRYSREEGVCRIWSVNFNFAKEGKAIPKEWSFKQALASITTKDKIKSRFAWVTAWRLNKLRPKLEILTEDITPMDRFRVEFVVRTTDLFICRSPATIHLFGVPTHAKNNAKVTNTVIARWDKMIN